MVYNLCWLLYRLGNKIHKVQLIIAQHWGTSLLRLILRIGQDIRDVNEPLAYDYLPVRVTHSASHHLRP